jgi:Ni,Fe-hydrogenase maturation factor
MAMKKVFVFGNPLVKEDSIALRAGRELRKTRKELVFKEIESLDELEEIPEELLVLDCAEGIEKVTVVSDLKLIEERKVIGSHDFDLGAELMLYKKLGKIKKVKLLLIPRDYGLEEAVRELNTILP